MGLFSKLFSSKTNNFHNPDTICQKTKNSLTTQEGIDVTTVPIDNFDSKEQLDRTPLWLSVPSDENREKDKLNTTDYSNVIVIFEYGEIKDVVPDVNNYYLATHYRINGIDYDISSISSVNDIPLPTSKPPADCSSLGTPVYRLEYLLRIHAGFARDEGNNELAYALMHKGTKMLKYSSLDWQRHDYLREYYWLLDDGKIEDAQLFFNEIESDLPAPYSEKEHVKEVQHYNYAVLKRNFPAEMPKSFSAYMRNYNKKDEKYQKFEELAKTLGIDL